MSEKFLNEKITLYCGDCLDVMATLEENSIDSCVTDPPYHLTSIVKRFGAGNAAPVKVNEFYDDGGNSKGSSPYLRSSSGFMGKKWDGGDIAFRPELWAAIYRVLKPGAHLLAMGGTRTFHRMACAIEDAGFEMRDTVLWLYGSGFPKSHDVSKGIDRAGGEETASQQWDGWGTALKPAIEMICLARKPLSEKTIAANVLRWGTGAINVDGCRVAGEAQSFGNGTGRHGGQFAGSGVNSHSRGPWESDKSGRWPANLVHDGSEEVLAVFPESNGQQGLVRGTEPSECHNGVYSGPRARQGIEYAPRGDSGSAARFFYTAKADADDRLGSKHPTVKPLDLMQWLVRLVTPSNGVVLDPFAGTGTTGEAAVREGMRAILIEREAEYQTDIRRRMALALAGPDERARESIKARGSVEEDPGPLFNALRP